jgi:hypothetical protein
MSGANNSAIVRQTGAIINQLPASQHFYDTQRSAQSAPSSDGFSETIEEFSVDTGESHYEACKSSVSQTFNEVSFAWVSSHLFHEFMEKAHNDLYYKTSWDAPIVFTDQEVREFYRENLTEDGCISF